MMQDLQKEMDSASQGAPTADGFAAQTSKAAEMIRQDPNIQLVFLDVGGWDTHVNQGNVKGQLANKLDKLGEGIEALVQGARPRPIRTAPSSSCRNSAARLPKTAMAAPTTAMANVAWLMGGGVRGGKVWSRWPGLDEARLFEGRDLAVTTDFRSIVGAVLAGHFGLDDRRIASIIPSYVPDQGLRGIVV